MKYLVTFLLIIFTNLSAQNTTEYFNFFYPNYLPNVSDTEIASVCRFADGEYDSIEIILNTDISITLNDVKLNTMNYAEDLEFRHLENYQLEGNIYSIVLDKDKYQLTNNPIQLIYNLNVDRINEGLIHFVIYYLKDGEIINEISSFDENKIKPIVLSTFVPQQLTSGNSLSLANNDNFEIDIKKSKFENLAIEFWGEFNDVSEFLKLYSDKSELLKLSKNKFKMLETGIVDDLEIASTTFLSKDSWNHFCIYYDSFDQKIKVYVNESLNFEFSAEILGDLKLVFKNSMTDFNLDLLRIWDWKGDLNILFENSKFNSSGIQTSNLIYQNNFDDLINTRFVFKESDAPIVSRAPEINIKSYSNFYVLEWSNNEYSNVDHFILEKSIDGKFFTEIYSIDKFTEDEQIYTFTDLRNSFDKLVYYRVKQINIDGSIIYSHQLKIGQKKKKNFVLKPNFPNPFNPTTKVTVELLEDTELSVTVYNVVGVKVDKIFDGSLGSGEHSFDFNGSELPSGIYLLEIKTPTSSEVMKMILAK